MNPVEPVTRSFIFMKILLQKLVQPRMDRDPTTVPGTLLSKHHATAPFAF